MTRLLLLALWIQLAMCQNSYVRQCEDAEEQITAVPDDVQLTVDCDSNELVNVSWVVNKVFVDLFIGSQCATANEEFNNSPMIQASYIGRDSPRQGKSMPFNVTAASKCRYFGCFTDIERVSAYFFSPVTCTYDQNAPNTISLQPSPSATVTEHIPHQTVNAQLNITSSVTMVNTSTQQMALDSTAGSKITPTTLHPDPSTSVSLHSHSKTTSQDINGISPVKTQSHYLTRSAQTHIQSNSEISSTAHTKIIPISQITPIPTTITAGRVDTSPAVWVAVFCAVLVLALTVGTGLLPLILFCRGHLRLHRESQGPIKIVRGLNDEEIDPNFFPVKVDPPLSTSPSAYSIVTICDELGESNPCTSMTGATLSMKPLLNLYNCDSGRFMDLENAIQDTGHQEDTDTSAQYDSVKIVDLYGSKYVKLHPSDIDMTGFSGVDEHSYISLHDNQDMELVTIQSRDNSLKLSKNCDTVQEQETMCNLISLQGNQDHSISTACLSKDNRSSQSQDISISSNSLCSTSQ